MRLLHDCLEGRLTSPWPKGLLIDAARPNRFLGKGWVVVGECFLLEWLVLKYGILLWLDEIKRMHVLLIEINGRLCLDLLTHTGQAGVVLKWQRRHLKLRRFKVEAKFNALNTIYATCVYLLVQ